MLKRKKIIYSLFSILLMIGTTIKINAQTCYPQGIVFTTQGSIDSFKINNPQCKIIEGDLVIGAYSTLITKNKDIYNLAPLNGIEEVRGKLIVSSIENIYDLSGLSRLKKVGSDIIIQGNVKINNLVGLEKLTGVEGNLEFFVNNVAKMSTKGLDNIRYIKGDLNIKSFGISSLVGLAKLDSIHGSLYVWGDGVSNFSDLKVLKYIGKNISIYDSEISSFTGLSNIKEIKGNLEVSDNPISFSGLQNLEVIHGRFRVEENGTSGSFAGLSKLREVKGDVYFYRIGKAEINTLTALEKIGGNLILIRSNLIGTPLRGMPLLKYIGGNLAFEQNDELKDYGEWPKLDTIKGSLTFYNHYSLTSLNGFNNLKYIGKDLRIELNKELTSVTGFGQLNVIKGSIEIINNVKLKTIQKLFSVPEINGFNINTNPLLVDLMFNNVNEVMNKSINVYSNSGLKSISGLSVLKNVHNITINLNGALTDINLAPSLRTVNGIFALENNNIKILNSFSQLDSIKGGLTLTSLNNSGQTLETLLPALTYLDGGIRLIQVTATDLPFLRGKKVINGQLTLQNINSLKQIDFLTSLDSVLGNVSLSIGMKSLESLASLTKVNGSFAINNCDSITNLKGLENLRYVKNSIFINFNDNLTSISEIQNIDTAYFNVYPSLFTLNLLNNPKLNDCEVKLICQLLTSGYRKVNLSSNGINCSKIELIDCLDNTMLSGKTYLDINKNNTLDSEDILAPLVRISVNDNQKSIFSNQYGRYFFVAEPNTTYVLKSEENENLTMVNDSITKLFTTDDEFKHDVNIALKFVKDTIRGQAFIPGPGVNRCSEIIQLKPKIVNTGTQKTNYRLRIYKSNYTFSSGSPTPKYLSAAYEWDFSNVGVLSSSEISVYLKMPDFKSAGHDLIIPYVLYIQKNGIWTIADSTTYLSTIVCAYDPNDKNVIPSGKKDQKFVLKNEELTYTIRFQNTGNAPAKDVIITDTLDSNFDLRSFHVIGSSHKVQTEQIGKYLSFNFRNIWLPDSISNKEGSKGFVYFRINAKDDIEECTVMKNKADIYFDFNPPITTNTVSNTLVSYICEDVIQKIDTTICTGENLYGYTKSGNYVIRFNKEKTCDTLVQLKLKVNPPATNYYSKNICEGDTIVLSNSKIRMTKNALSVRDTIFRGKCIDSIYSYLFLPLFAKKTVLDTTICEGYDVFGYNQSGTYTITMASLTNQCIDTLQLLLTILPKEDQACITSTDNVELDEITIFPNPSSGTFKINVNKAIKSVRISNSLGQLVPIPIVDNLFQLNESGIYLIEVTLSNMHAIRKKLIVLK